MIPIMKNKYCLPVLLILFSCSGKEEQGFAHIVQRRLQPGGSLMISYRFDAGNKTIYDSLVLPNKVIRHDSLPVLFSSGNPANNHLILP